MLVLLMSLALVLLVFDLIFFAWLWLIVRENVRRELSWRRLTRAQNAELRRVADEIASRV